MLALLAKVASTALYQAKCENAQAGWIHESCSLECNQDTGKCEETLVIEDCECEADPSAEFESYTFYYEVRNI